jgi:small subunit ribosomal protein S16
MVRIRLRRVGAKKQASYRIVVINRQAAATGRPIETIGHFNPRTEPETVIIQVDRALYWLGVGAQPSDAVLRLLKNEGIMDQFASIKAGEVTDSSEEEAIEAKDALPADDEYIDEEEE